jgi:flagellar motor switch protein FliN/FliY
MPETEKQKPDELNELMKMLGVEADEGASAPPPSVAKPAYDALMPSGAESGGAGMDLLADVNVNVRVELGRNRMQVQDILKLGPGSVVPLESRTGDPLDIYVNDRLVARGEALVVNDAFALRVTEVLSAKDIPKDSA